MAHQTHILAAMNRRGIGPLLGNGSVTYVPVATNRRESSLLVNGSPNTHSRDNGYNKVIHELSAMVIYIRFAWKLVQFSLSSFVREFSVQLRSVNQRTTEAGEARDS
jgi:hypothetical protein